MSDRIQIEFLVKANNWLANHENQKKYGITDNDTNPNESKLCIYVLGGWAINRYFHYRETIDIDLIADEKQLVEMLKSMSYSKDFTPISSPDSNVSFTQKHTLQNKTGNHFSLEARFFNSTTDEIHFGKFKINREWLYVDSKNFNERTTSTLKHIQVPSINKLIALKAISAIGRKSSEKNKIVADLQDIHNLQLSNTFRDKDYNEVIEILSSLGFKKDESKLFSTVLDEFYVELNNKVENSLSENSILNRIRDFETTSPIIVNNQKVDFAATENTTTSKPKNIHSDEYLPQIGILSEQKDIFYQIVNLIQQATSDIHIFISSGIESIFLDFIMILAAKKIFNQNIEIIYFDDLPALPVGVQERTYSRIRLFKQFGFKVKICKPTTPRHFFTGIITDPNTSDVKLLSLKKGLGDSVHFFGEALFLDETQSEIINLLYNSLKSEYFKVLDFVQTQDNIRVVEISPEEYIQFLKNVNMYKHVKETDFKFVEYTSLDLNKILTKQRGVKEFKKLQHEHVYQMLGLSKNKIYAIELLNHVKHVVNIPVIEVFNGQYYLIEGHTRLFNLMHNSDSEKVLVVEIRGLIDSKAYLEYTHPFTEIKLNEISPNHKKSQFSRDLEKYTHINYYMKFDPINYKNTVKLFPLSTDYE